MARSTVIANLKILLSASHAKLNKDFNSAKQASKGFLGSIRASGTAFVAARAASVGFFASIVAGAAAAMAALGPIGVLIAVVGVAIAALTASYKFSKFAVGIAAEAEQTKVAFETMLSSARAADQLIQQIDKFAASTPFENPEIKKASKSLLAFGVSGEKVIPTLRRIGDVASGLSVPLNELAVIYGKAKVQGRLFARDVQEFHGRGIPMAAELAKLMGVSKSEIMGMVSEGKIGFEQLEQVFASLTGEGGQFQDLMEKQSRTLKGLWNNLKDEIGLFAREWGNVLLPYLKWGLSLMVDFAKAARVAAQSLMGNKNLGTDALEGLSAQTEEALDDIKTEVSDAMKEIENFATSLAERMKTPLEKFADQAGKIHEAFDAGKLSSETYARAMADARKSVMDQVEGLKEVRSLQRVHVGAVDRRTMAGVRAIQEAKDQVALIRDQKKLDQDRNAKLDAMNAHLNKISQNSGDKINVVKRRV